MLRKLFALVLAAALCIVNVRTTDRETELAMAGGAAAVGAIVGGGAFAALGKAGIMLASVTVTTGAAPFIAGGAVAGFAAYRACQTSGSA